MPTLRRKKGTEKLAPVTCAHAEEEEGYREACPCYLCPRWGRRRVQRSLLLSPVPTLRQKKGTGGVRLAGGKPALTMQVQYYSYIGLYCFSSIKLISGSKDRNIKAKKYHPDANDMPAVYLTGAYHWHPGGRSMRSTTLFIIPVKRNPWNSSSGSIQSVWQWAFVLLRSDAGYRSGIPWHYLLWCFRTGYP